MSDIKILDIEIPSPETSQLVSLNTEIRAKHHLPEPCSHLVEDDLLQHQIYPFYDPEVIREHFANEGRLSTTQIQTLIKQSIVLFKKEPNLIEVIEKEGAVVEYPTIDNDNLSEISDDNVTLGDYSFGSPLSFKKAVSVLFKTGKPSTKDRSERSNSSRNEKLNPGEISEGLNKMVLRESDADMIGTYSYFSKYSEKRIVVIGDIHGQFYDMQNILKNFDPRIDTLIFLGDYVDRGRFSTEVYFYLLSLKIFHPSNVILLRGNHESERMTKYFTFKEECLFKYSGEIYKNCLKSFDSLPLCAVINGKFFCAHGGIGPNMDFSKINKINRYGEPPFDGIFCDLLWSDPHSRYDSGIFNEDFLRNTQRNCSFFYTPKAVKSFFEKTGVECIIRGHEVQSHGYRFYASEETRKYKKSLKNKTVPKKKLGSSGQDVQNDFLRDQKKLDGFQKAFDVNFSQRNAIDGKSEPKTSNLNGIELKNDHFKLNHGHIEANKIENRVDCTVYENDLGKLHKCDFTLQESSSSEDQMILPDIITVFSAPNYCDAYSNLASVVQVYPHMRVMRFNSVQHPYYLANYLDGVNWSFPFVSEKLSEYFLDILKYLEEQESVVSSPVSRVENQDVPKQSVILEKHLSQELLRGLDLTQGVSEMMEQDLKLEVKGGTFVSVSSESDFYNLKDSNMSGSSAEVECSNVGLKRSNFSGNDDVDSFLTDNLATEMEKTKQFTNAMVLLRTEREGTSELDEESTDLSLVSITDPETEVIDFEEAKMKDTKNETFKTEKDLKNGISTNLSSSLCSDVVQEDIALEECKLQIDGKKVQVVVTPTKKNPSKFCWSTQN